MQRMTATTIDQPRPAYQLLVWLLEGCAQVPRCQGTSLRFFNARLIACCTHCGHGKERLAHQIGSRFAAAVRASSYGIILTPNIRSDAQPSAILK